jgi:hypothetical protein
MIDNSGLYLQDRQKLTQLDIHRRFESSFQLAFEDMKLSISTSNTNRLSMIDRINNTSILMNC